MAETSVWIKKSHGRLGSTNSLNPAAELAKLGGQLGTVSPDSAEPPAKMRPPGVRRVADVGRGSVAMFDQLAAARHYLFEIRFAAGGRAPKCATVFPARAFAIPARVGLPQ
jgi:hypothetical protein